MYREIVKEICNTYKSNQQLRKYWISVLKNTVRGMRGEKEMVVGGKGEGNGLREEDVEDLTRDLLSILKSIYKGQYDKKKVEMHSCFIKADHGTLKDNFDLENGEKEMKKLEESPAFEILQYVQLYYLIYNKKIFSKKNFTSHQNFLMEAMEYEPKVTICKEKDIEMKIDVILPSEKLSALF